MADSGKAVFLSYASQDTEAARRICEALRAAGVEVWFDQSELVGGDAWDQKIRKQIKDCALLIPIISANTQSRTEGYFRLEWRLADQRTHLMGRNKAFLLPVAIDDTTDADADVPDSFSAVQWTKAPGGEVPAAFCARVKKLLSGEPRAVSRETRTENREQGTANRQRPRWMAPVIGGIVVAAIALAIAQPWRKTGALPAIPPSTPVAPLTEARKLVAQARKLFEKGDDALRDNFTLGEDFLKKAVALDPTEAEASAAYSQLSRMMWALGYDRSAARKESTRQHAERAIKLDPEAFEARLAMSAYLTGVDSRRPEAEAGLRKLAAERPDDARAMRWLAHCLRWEGRLEEALPWLDRAAAVPGGDPVALLEKASALMFSINPGPPSRQTVRRYAEMEAPLRQARELRPIGRVLMAQIFWLTNWQHDLAAAEETLARLPAGLLAEDRGVFLAASLRLQQHRWDEAIVVLNAHPRAYLEDAYFTGPKGLLTGFAHRMAGRPEAARTDFAAALRLVRQRIESDPAESSALMMLGLLHATLGEAEQADAAWRAHREKVPLNRFDRSLEAWTLLFLGRREEALDIIERCSGGDHWDFTWATLQSPWYDSVRTHPRFMAAMEKARRIAADLGVPGAQRAGEDGTAVDDKSAPADKSVAVLAFANLSDDKANEYFSDGISEELLNVLAKIPGLKVSARTSAFYFKGKEVPIPEIAKQLGVAYVVEGSVRKAGDKVRITAQLIKAADGFHVWSDTFTRDIKDVFAVQDEIAGLIARNISPVLNPPKASTDRALAPEAIQEYLVGRAAVAKASNVTLREAVTHFERAVEVEPKFTAAWVQLANTHTQLGRWGGAPARQSWLAARAAIDRAIALEPDSPDVLVALGWIFRTGEWKWREAEQAFRRALALRPNQPEVLAGAAVLLYNIGQTDEAFRLGRQAAQLDPLNASTQIDLSIMFYLRGDLAEAETAARRALQLAPNGTSYHAILAWSLIDQGRFAEAEAEIARETDPVEQPTAYGRLVLARGDEAGARKAIAQLEALAQTNPDLADLQQSIAWICSGLGEKDRAFAALERAKVSRDPSMAWLLGSSYLVPLHTDPRWPVLVRSLGLADEQLK